MSRDELILSMAQAFYSNPTSSWNAEIGMATALDVAVEHFLLANTDYHLKLCWNPEDIKACNEWVRNRFAKPKSDPAVEAVKEIVDEVNRRGGLRYGDYAERIVAAVRKADAK